MIKFTKDKIDNKSNDEPKESNSKSLSDKDLEEIDDMDMNSID